MGVETPDVTQPVGNGWVGQSLKRKEDPRLITGRATYVEDIMLPGMLHAALVRSSEAHAKITSIDTTAAREQPGVIAVFTGEDMADLAAPCPMVWVPPGVDVHVPEHWPLARGKVGYVGQAVAVVLATERSLAFDAAEQILVDYDPLPVILDPEQALEDGAPIIHEDHGSNKVFEWSLEGGDTEAALAGSDVVIERRVVNHRTAGAAIEPRGTVAEWREGMLTMWSATQIPHIARVILSIQMGLSEEKIRVVAPEVGGGFGSKLQVYGEEVLACWCARKLGRPVKWIATRSDDMATTHHGRDQIDYVRLGAKRDGTLTGIHDEDHPGLWLLPPDRGAGDPHVQLLRDERLLRLPRAQDGRHRGVHEQVHDRRHPRRRPARGHAPDRGLHGPAGGRARDGSARAPAQELHHGVPQHQAARVHLRLRRLPRHARQVPGDARPRRLQARAGRAARAQGLPRCRLLHVRGDLRPRPVAGARARGMGHAGRLLRVRDGARAPDRLGDRLHRHLAARPGPRDGLRPDRGRPAGRHAPTSWR